MLEAGFEMNGFQNGLALDRAGQDGAGDEIGNLAGVAELIQKFEGIGGRQAGQQGRRRGVLKKGRKKGKAEFHAVIQEFADLGEQGIHREVIGRRGFEGPDALNPIGFVADRLDEFDPGDALQEQMRRAVVVLDGAADESQAGDGRGDSRVRPGFCRATENMRAESRESRSIRR